MPTINFGVSSYVRFAPGVPWQDRVMEIPEEGELPPPSMEYLGFAEANPQRCGVPNYTNSEAGQFVTLHAVRFELPHGGFWHCMWVLWVAERREWIAVHHTTWPEGVWGRDETEEGPFAADEYCLDMLATAYGIDARQVDPERLRRLSPGELARFAVTHAPGGPVAPEPPYVTLDGSTVAELVRPQPGGSRNVSVARAVVDAGGTTRRHYHIETDEVYYVLSGKGAVLLGEKWTPVKTGSCVLIPAGQVHAARCEGDRALKILCVCSPPYAHERTVLAAR